MLLYSLKGQVLVDNFLDFKSDGAPLYQKRLNLGAVVAKEGQHAQRRTQELYIGLLTHNFEDLVHKTTLFIENGDQVFSLNNLPRHLTGSYPHNTMKHTNPHLIVDILHLEQHLQEIHISIEVGMHHIQQIVVPDHQLQNLRVPGILALGMPIQELFYDVGVPQPLRHHIQVAVYRIPAFFQS